MTQKQPRFFSDCFPSIADELDVSANNGVTPDLVLVKLLSTNTIRKMLDGTSICYAESGEGQGEENCMGL